MKTKLKFMIVAGEASGDAHAAKLVKALRENYPSNEFDFFGATGAKLRAVNVETIVNADNMAIVGLPEIARALPMFWNAFQTLKKAAVDRKPDAVILIDFPDFNLKLAKSLKKQNLKIIYYISPQIWAWRKHRIKTIERYVDLLLTILPFEKNWYARNGIAHVEFVGNPLAREVHADVSSEEFRAKHSMDLEKPLVALLAGSRHKEISRILPPMLETAWLMESENSDLQFVVALNSSKYEGEIDAAKLKIKAAPKNLRVVFGETWNAVGAADVAAVTSGTATLETAILNTPLAIVYKTSALNYKLLRPLISVEHFGLINLIAEQRLAKELIQNEFTPETLAAELFRLLEPANNKEMRGQLRRITDTLGKGGASKRAADFIMKFLNGKAE